MKTNANNKKAKRKKYAQKTQQANIKSKRQNKSQTTRKAEGTHQQT